LRAQYGCNDVLTGVHPLAIKQSEEKCLVANDWAAVAAGQLLAVVPRWSGSDTVTIPCIRVERRVLDVPHGGAAKLVRARFGQNLYLPDASAHLCIRGRDDHTHFADQVRVDARGGKNADIVSSITNRDPVAHRVHGTHTRVNAGEGFGCPVRTNIASGCSDS